HFRRDVVARIDLELRGAGASGRTKHDRHRAAMGTRESGRSKDWRSLCDRGEQGHSGGSAAQCANTGLRKVQFHVVSEEKGVSHRQEMRALEIAPGEMIAFSPGRMHIMLMGVKAPLKEGQTLPLTLPFERAGTVEVTVPIAKVGAMQPGAHMHGQQDDGMNR